MNSNVPVFYLPSGWDEWDLPKERVLRPDPSKPPETVVVTGPVHELAVRQPYSYVVVPVQVIVPPKPVIATDETDDQDDDEKKDNDPDSPYVTGDWSFV